MFAAVIVLRDRSPKIAGRDRASVRVLACDRYMRLVKYRRATPD
jgi:hypothetical protein